MIHTVYSRNIEIYFSLLSCNDGNFAKLAETTTCDGFHLDIMDGYAVASNGVPLSLLIPLRSYKKPIQIHLMVINTEAYVEIISQMEIRPDTIFFHPCWAKDPVSVAESLRKSGIRVGIVWNDDNADRWFDIADELMFMTVIPGRGGQSMITDRITKIERLMCDKPCWIDGGVNSESIKLIQHLPLKGVVSGSGISSFYTA